MCVCVCGILVTTDLTKLTFGAAVTPSSGAGEETDEKPSEQGSRGQGRENTERPKKRPERSSSETSGEGKRGLCNPGRRTLWR